MLKTSQMSPETQCPHARLQRPIAKRKANDELISILPSSSASRPSRSREAKVTKAPNSYAPSGSRSNAAKKTMGPQASDKWTSSKPRPLKAKRSTSIAPSMKKLTASPPSRSRENNILAPSISSMSSGSRPNTTRQASIISSPNMGVSDESSSVSADVGHPRPDIHIACTGAQPSVSWPVGQASLVNQAPCANRALSIAATDQIVVSMPPKFMLSDIVAAIKEQYRRRQDFLQEEGSLSRRIKKIVARLKGQMTATDAEVLEMSQTYLPLIPFLDSLKLLKTARLQEERKLKKHAESLPIWESFGHPIMGFGSLSLGAIIGEAGDLGIYANPAKLWKRMGLALIGSERQRKCVDKEKAERHGYSPRRRSVMFMIGDNLVKQKSAYRTVYDERKVREIEKAAEEGLTVAPAAKIPKGKHAEYRSEGHIHLRAKRYMEKRLLRDLWRAWRSHRAIDIQITVADPCAPESKQ